MNENTNTEFRDWKEMKRQQRDAVITAQRDALMDVFMTGESLVTYLVGRGRLGSHLTSGNAALVLQVKPDARVVMNYDGWKRFGRSVGKGAEGIEVLTRSNGFLNTERVFEISQTYGNKPYPNTEIAEDPDKLAAALAALEELCLVSLEKGETEKPSIVYEPEEKKIYWKQTADPADVFRLLPAAMVRATTDLHTAGVSAEDLTRLFSIAVSVELCGRFGVPVLEGAADVLNSFRDHVEVGMERETLESIREISRTLGDHIAGKLVTEKADLQPDRQEGR